MVLFGATILVILFDISRGVSLQVLQLNDGFVTLEIRSTRLLPSYGVSSDEYFISEFAVIDPTSSDKNPTYFVAETDSSWRTLRPVQTCELAITDSGHPLEVQLWFKDVFGRRYTRSVFLD